MLLDDLIREDVVGLVLRGQLHIEHQLIELASLFLPEACRCDWGLISYRGKLALAAGCGMPADVIDALRKIGQLRNSFAHTLQADISRKSVQDLYNGLPENVRESLKHSYLATGRGPFSSPSELHPKELLVLILLNLRQFIKARVIQVRAQRDQELPK